MKERTAVLPETAIAVYASEAGRYQEKGHH